MRRTPSVRMSTTAATLAVCLLAAACSGDESTDTPTPDPVASTPEPAADATAPPADDPAAPEVGAMGSFTVDGQTFAVTDLNRCDPFFDEPGNLDLQAIAQGALLNLPVLGGGTSIDISVQGSALVELAGSNVFGDIVGEPGFTITDDRITGAATLGDTMGSDASVMVTFDVAIPDEVRDC